MDIHTQVLEAASTLVAAFAANDSDAYFAAFSADASFIFHSSEQVLGDNVALLCHEVVTRLHLADQDVESHERETIVFRREHANAPWLACHEHLSAMPQPLPPT